MEPNVSFKIQTRTATNSKFSAVTAAASPQTKSLPDIPQGEAFSLQRLLEPLNRLVRAFLAQLEGLVMDREEIVRAGFVRHPHGLLGRAMGANPRMISADRHDRQFKRPLAAQRLEGIGHRRVAAKDNFPALALKGVAVVAAIG